MLEGLVHEGNAFHALTFNLCTIYELCTDKSRALKVGLAEQVAALSDSDGTGWEKSVVDFKL
jgi:trafficking protein particle complex subunit 12